MGGCNVVQSTSNATLDHGMRSDSLYVPTSAIVEAEQLLAQECV